MKPTFLEGGIAVDDRGSVSFVNGFSLKDVKRFYRVENFSCDVIRAFHGHMKEAKYVYVAKGSALVAAVPLDDVKNPSTEQRPERFVLSEKRPGILHIPPMYANGFKPLEKDTVLIFFSTSTVEESKGDDYRFPADHWGNDVWTVEDR